MWENRSLSLRDWILADAWYRSRCLDLPRSGTALVPAIDMANHSPTPMARYDESDDHEAVLVLRHDASIVSGDEVTITYGEDKSAAEILFSYGFIDTETSARHLVLPVPVLDDDPLLRAKLYSFGGPPMAKLWLEGDKPGWKSPFAYFLCLNEEDGLEFRTLQEVSGARQLRVFWQEEDVTDRVDEFQSLTAGHPMSAIFRLRVVSVIEELAGTHLDRMKAAAMSAEDEVLREVHGEPRRECAILAGALREAEFLILETVLEALQEEVRVPDRPCFCHCPLYPCFIANGCGMYCSRSCDVFLPDLRVAQPFKILAGRSQHNGLGAPLSPVALIFPYIHTHIQNAPPGLPIHKRGLL